MAQRTLGTGQYLLLDQAAVQREVICSVSAVGWDRCGVEALIFGPVRVAVAPMGGQGQTEVPYSTEEQRLAAAQVLALLALAEGTKDLSASIDMGLRGDGGSGIGKAIESALGVADVRHQAGLVEAIENLAAAR